jgi:outer membrane protein TolC
MAEFLLMFTIRKHTLFLFLLLSVFAANAQESMIQEVSFDYLDKLVLLARENYPKVKMYEHKQAKAKAGIEKANYSWFDLFNFTYLYSNNAGATLVNPTISNGYQMGVYFNAGNLLTKPSGVKIAKEDYKAAKEDLNEYYLNLEAEVKKRYYTYVKEMTILKMRSQNAINVESTSKLLKYKFEKGESSLRDYSMALTDVSNATQLKIEAEAAMLTAKSSLEELIGVKLETVK